MIGHSILSDTPINSQNTDLVRVMPLSEIQQRVALLLATGHTAREVAHKMGLAEVTIYRWRQQPEFIAVVRGILKENKQALNERLNNLAIKAIEVLEAVIDDPNASTVDKINAASKVLELVNLNSARSTHSTPCETCASNESPSEEKGCTHASETSWYDNQ